MARPDLALLDPARYPFTCAIETRYRDVDSNMHINNGVMATLLEECRVRFHREARFGPNGPDVALGVSVVVASIAIEYLGESHFPAPLDLHLGILRLGNSSYDVAQLATQQGRPVVYAHTTLVSVMGGAPAPIVGSQRTHAKQWMLRP